MRRKLMIWAVLVTTTAAAAAGAMLSMRSRSVVLPVVNPDDTRPVLFDAPTFSLTDQNGKAFDGTLLRGKVWAADFVFTHCGGICPMMTHHMTEFQTRTAGSPIQMVSFSVDPENDTPPVLKQYAAENKADESRWHFLTGTREQTWEVYKGMKLAVGQDTGNQILHSNRFMLVDGEGKVRGTYAADDADFMTRLVNDATALAKEK